ncbi:MAG: LL-diaminopimelate aminotransferase [Verrucomicrobia bacterium]|nr:LL-diaminopimelate aminotransferase [Verrucomicrobiota bacterium]
MKRNPYFEQISNRYLFQEVRHRLLHFKDKSPDARVISLSIGDTTEPIGPHTIQGLHDAVQALGDRATYTGYGPEQGFADVREAISKTIYQGKVPSDDIFVSDGSKCDIGRLQLLFGPACSVALQTPSYPVYQDTSLLFRNNPLILLPCTAENGFVPDLSPAASADILFLCNPCNPTGRAFSFSQLEQIVHFAIKHSITIIFDSAYSSYVQPGFPKSIYEIPGADTVAIELGSFSKIAGFSGVRLAWSVVPSKLNYSTGQPIKPDWMRIATTFFNGASIISQKGGMAVLSDAGMKEIDDQVNFYLANTKILKEAFTERGLEVYGGTHSPYLWVRFHGLSSWQAFDKMLQDMHIVTTPGIGFGQAGDGFLRISSFGSRASVTEAANRIKGGCLCSTQQ